jgi:signal transduction histidine kinase
MSDKSRTGKTPGRVPPSLAQMLVKAINERETELAKVAQILHDEVGQVLSAVGLQLDVMRMDFKDRLPEIEGRTAEVQAMLESVIAQLRNLSYELNPSVVERAGLQVGLDRLVGRIRENFQGNIRLFYDPNLRVSPRVARDFYRIAESAVEDALEYPGCKQIEISVKQTKNAQIQEVRYESDLFSPERADEPARIVRFLLMDHYATRGNLSLERKQVGERGMLFRTCHRSPAEPPETE